MEICSIDWGFLLFHIFFFVFRFGVLDTQKTRTHLDTYAYIHPIYIYIYIYIYMRVRACACVCVTDYTNFNHTHTHTTLNIEIHNGACVYQNRVVLSSVMNHV